MLVHSLVHNSESCRSRSKFQIFITIGTWNEEYSPKSTHGQKVLTLIVLMTTIVNVFWVRKWLVIESDWF